MTKTECTHKRQVRIADTETWICEDCMALMDTEHPTRVMDQPMMEDR